MDALIFLVFAIIAVVCGVLVVTQKHPVSSALSLIGVMGSLAVMYLLLGAQFIAAAQVVVYAGAIMVLFVFVIMLLNAGAEEPTRGSIIARFLGIPALVLLLGVVAFLVWRAVPNGTRVKFGEYTAGTAYEIGAALFTRYLLPFEITSILVLIAIVGAVVLAYKELE